MKKRHKSSFLTSLGIGALIFAVLYALSWIITCGIIWLITLCFGWIFKWKIATGIWLILCVAIHIFKNKK